MNTFNFDELEYKISDLSPEAKLQYDMVVAANKRLSELKLDAAMIQTALSTYALALKALLPAPSVKSASVDESGITQSLSVEVGSRS